MVGDEVVIGKKLYDAARKGDVATFEELVEEDPYVVDVVSFACSRNVLHIATMHGQMGIVKEVLRRNPELARNLDSQKSSALHIAAAQGYVEIASKLISEAPEICWWRDCHGMNPIHVAAMKGHVEILEELVRRDPFPATEKLDRGQTVLQLCVKHRQLRALEYLVHNFGELVYAEDDDGETVLHSAVRFKQVEVVRHLVENNKIGKLSTNSKGKTVRQISVESSRDTASAEIEEILLHGTKLLNDSVEFLRKMSDITMVVVVLIATMAFQAAVSPPGGVWQDDTSLHRAGEAVMASNRPKIFTSFKQANTVAFAFSLIAILLLTTGLPSKHSFFTAAVVWTTWVSLASIAVSYGASIMVITPDMETQSLARVVNIVVIVSLTMYGVFYVGACFVKLHSWMKTTAGRGLEASRLDSLFQGPVSSLLQRPLSSLIQHVGQRLHPRKSSNRSNKTPPPQDREEDQEPNGLAC